MSRVRPVEGVLAATAAVLACLPLASLFTSATWLRPALVCVLVVAGTGMLARRVTRSSALVVVIQLVVLVETLAVVYGQGHLWYGLPRLDTVLAFNTLLYDARVTVTQFAAPAPTSRGVALALGMIVSLVALAVDATAVTRRAPALAGLPLLAAYLVTASNSGDPLPWLSFVAPAAAWLVLLAHQGIGGMKRWGSVTPVSDPHGRAPAGDATRGFVDAARVLGATAIVAALVVPMVTPHLPTRFLIEGLGRTDTGEGPPGGGEVRLSTSIDLSRSLRSQSTRPVLTYRTNDPDPGPLRVAVLSRFADGIVVPSREPDVAPQEDFAVPAPAGLDRTRFGQGGVPTYRIEVDDNKLLPPQLAAPAPVLRGDLGGTRWSVDRDGVVRVTARTPSYAVDYAGVDPPRSLLAGSGSSLESPAVGVRDLILDPGSERRVRAVTAQVVPEGANEIEAAVAIQDYLRGPEFTYSLELAGPTRDENGRLVMRDPISHFLETKRGYCQQFATTMVMMARAEDIPARLALGFLPGTLVGDRYEVRASDAHAWPELFFEGVGWLRFEPTPSERTGLAPGYTDLTRDRAPSTGGSTPSASPSPSSDARPDQPNPADLGADPGSTSAAPALSWERVRTLPRAVVVILGALVALLVALSVPFAASFRRRRSAHEEDRARRVESQWQAMLRRLDDLGISPPSGSTPRQTGEFLRHEAYLADRDAQALHRVVATLERARYAPPGIELPDITTDTGTVVRAVTASRRRSDRVRAWWLPQDGLGAWRGLGDAALGAPRRAWRRLRRPG